MRAVAFEGPGRAAITNRPAPLLDDSTVVVDVAAVGLCATDWALFDGSMPYLRTGEASYPLVPGHEWSGTVAATPDADAPAVQVGAHVVAEVFIGCGRCAACEAGRPNVCAARREIGVRGGWDGALADQLLVPSRVLHQVPDGVGPLEAVFVEPGSTALAAVERGGVRKQAEVVVWGAGTLGLLALQVATAREAAVDVVDVDADSLALARRLGARDAVHPDQADTGAYDVAIDATGAAHVPSRAAASLRAGGHLVLLGVPGMPSTLDVVTLVHRDLDVSGVLGGIGRFPGFIELLASGAVRVTPLIQQAVEFDDVPHVFAAGRPRTSPPKLVVRVGASGNDWGADA